MHAPDPDPRQLSRETIAVVTDRLGHPFGQRATDPQLAVAVLTGHLGLRTTPAEQTRSIAQAEFERRSLRDFPGHPRQTGIRAALARVQRVWRLYRLHQVDQGTTPWCVDATRCHWQLSLPTYGRLTHGLGELYAECKKIDPWIGQDGTSMWFMLQVLERLGLVESSWWYQSPVDREATLRWLTDTGGMMLGANWPEAAFRTRRLANGSTDGVIEVPAGAHWLYGHETFLVGRERNYKRMGPHIQGVQSWGLSNYGIRGRFWIPEEEFFSRWLDPEQGWGDLCGLVERAA